MQGENVQTLLGLEEGNWIVLGEGGGWSSSLWKPTCSVMLRCAAMCLGDPLWNTMT